MKARDHFHGKLLDMGAGRSPYENLIMANGKVDQYVKLDFAVSTYHQGATLDPTWDGHIIPFEAESVDTVLMTEVLEHVRQPSEIVCETRRVLKPDGTLFSTNLFT